MPKKYESYKLTELKQKAKLRNIKGGYKMNKSQLIENLRKKQKKQGGMMRKRVTAPIPYNSNNHKEYIDNVIFEIGMDIDDFTPEIYGLNPTIIRGDNATVVENYIDELLFGIDDDEGYNRERIRLKRDINRSHAFPMDAMERLNEVEKIIKYLHKELQNDNEYEHVFTNEPDNNN